MNLEINNLTKVKINEKELLTVFQKAKNVLKLKSAKVSLAFISELEIKKLNKIYRGKDKVCDVLSFGTRDIKRDFPEQSLEKDFLGEIVICPEFVKTKLMIGGPLDLDAVRGGIKPRARRTVGYGERRGTDSNEEMRQIQISCKELFVHGLLHLLGYDHEGPEKQALKMEKLEETILN